MSRRWWWIIGIVVAVGASVAWYLASPLFISKTVVEEFPMSAKATVPEGMTRQEVENALMEATKQTTTSTDLMPAQATVLARGRFVDADAFHKGSGMALIAQVDGQRLLRLEEFQVTNGPDLYVYLAAHPKPATREDVDQGFLNLGRLKGNLGAQNYELVPGTDLSRYRSVVIYCQRFHVVFATATLGTTQ